MFFASRIAHAMIVMACAAMPSVANAQARQQAKPAPPDTSLVVTIDEPLDWAPAASGTRSRGIIAATRSSIRVTGTARHPFGVREVLLNKNRAATAELPDGSTQFIGYVRVEDRMTNAEVTVVTKTGQRIPVRYNITPVEPPKAEEKPEAAWAAKTSQAGFKGQRWAVVIGISKYQDTALPQLKYADADAKSFYDFLRSPLAGMGGFDADHIRVLLNENATYRNMRVALFDFLKNATAEDVVYIYFAGHGSPDPDRRENMYLLPYDAQAKSIGGTSFPMEDMNKALRQVTAAHKILITDACHSGGVMADGSRAFGVNEINAAFLERMSMSSSVHMMFTASSESETSAEGEEWGGGHGVFTHNLLEGLKGLADADHDQLVDLQEMVNYASIAVERATRGAQHPKTAATAYDQSFPVALVLPGQQIVSTSAEEIEKVQRERTLTDKAEETTWIPADSTTLIAGMPDTLRVRLQTPEKDIIPPTWFTWTSSDDRIATVDAYGVVMPRGGGTVRISATHGARKAETTIRVHPSPSDVIFSPAENTLTLVLTESFPVRSDLLIGTNQWVRDMAPRLDLSDSSILKQQPGLKFDAVREGTTKVRASIGGRTKEWIVNVIPPNVRIKPLPVAIPSGDTIALAAMRVRPDGGVLGDAANVVWQSLDTTRAVVRDGRLISREIGKATVVAKLGTASDTVSTFVLGDLLAGTDGNGGPNVYTVGINGGKPTALLPKGTPGGEPALSPKGDRIAFVSNKRVFVMESDGSNVRRLTPDMKGLLGGRISSYEEHSPSWTSDGSRVVFISNAPGNYEVYSIAPDGTDVQRLTDDSNYELNVSAAPDIPRIAFDRVVASDNAEVVIALPDGSQQQRLQARFLFGDRKFSQVKPKLLPGGKEMVVVKRWQGRDGESLHIARIDTTLTTKDLVREEKDYALVFAVSPDGSYIAYHRTTEWAKKDNSIVVMDRSGTILKTITLGSGIDVKSLAWGASRARAKEEK